MQRNPTHYALTVYSSLPNPYLTELDKKKKVHLAAR